MKWIVLTTALAGSALLAACAGLAPDDGPKARVSPDYMASQGVAGVRAFVYGNRTVLEFDSRPLWLTVQDENGVPVQAEREGHYYRLARKLDHFTVWANTRAIAFDAATATNAESAVIAAPASVRAMPGKTPSLDLSPPLGDAAALLTLSTVQLEEVRRAIASGASSAGEARALNARLDRIEAQIAKAGTVVVRIQFDSAETNVDPDSALFRALVPAAKVADRVNVRGRTDAQVAGANDLNVAIGRALAARKALIDRGVDAAKINVFFLAAGDFVAPSSTTEGRALNRRVEIELVYRHRANPSRPKVALAVALR